jgi:hypothetical protein
LQVPEYLAFTGINYSSVSMFLMQVPVVKSIQQIREARLQPLKVALQDAIALHTKATGVREALEAEVG